MRVLVTGGTGLIGSHLIKALTGRGDEVTALTRETLSPSARALAAVSGVSVERWPAPDRLLLLLSRVDAVVNLAGEPIVAKRWSSEQKERIRRSRVDTTRMLFDAMRSAPRRPAVAVNASAVGYYGPHRSEALTENDPPGTDFLAEICQEWEAATEPVPEGTRVVLTRFGVVFDRSAGALDQMVRPFRLFAGGPIGDGSQWVSWIHIDDAVGLLLFALDTPGLSGPINATSPEPVTNRELSALIGRTIHRPSWLPVPKAALRVAVGEVAEVLVTGQRVLPEAAVKAGYRFAHSGCAEALRDLLA